MYVIHDDIFTLLSIVYWTKAASELSSFDYLSEGDGALSHSR